MLTEIFQKRGHILSQLIAVVSAFHDDRGRESQRSNAMTDLADSLAREFERAERIAAVSVHAEGDDEGLWMARIGNGSGCDTQSASPVVASTE